MNGSPILRSLFLMLLFAGATAGIAASEPSETKAAASAWARSFGRFIESLEPHQREAALYPFEDDERFDLRLAPLGLEGLRLDEMTDAQWAALEGLLGGVLSPTGLEKLNTIRSLEVEVAELEGGLLGFLMKRIRDTERYFLAVFGLPDPSKPWGLRFDGHHLSLNWAAIPGRMLSVTPVFWGAQPRRVPDGLARAGLRALPEEEDRALDFLNGLTAAERAIARVAFSRGGGIRRPMSVAGEVPLEPGAPDGLARGLLSPAQRRRLDAVLEVQLENFSQPIAAHYRARLEAQRDSIRFVFAIPEADVGRTFEPGQSLYYRLQGSGFLLEYDNTSEAADHVHVVWRDLERDFGRDVLAEHLASAHSSGH